MTELAKFIEKSERRVFLNLASYICENIPPMWLKPVGIDAIFITEDIRQQFAKKISARIIISGNINGVFYRLIQINFGSKTIGGILLDGNGRQNLSEFSYNDLFKELSCSGCEIHI